MSDLKYTDDDIQRLGGVIAEQIIDQFKAGFEALDSIANNAAKIPTMESNLAGMTSDVKVIKAAITENSRDMHAMANRVSLLEATR